MHPALRRALVRRLSLLGADALPGGARHAALRLPGLPRPGARPLLRGILGPGPAHRADEDPRPAAAGRAGPPADDLAGARSLRGRARLDPARSGPRTRGPSGAVSPAPGALRVVLLRPRPARALRCRRGHAPGPPARRAGAPAQGGDQSVKARTREAT